MCVCACMHVGATDYGLDGPGSNPSGDEIFRLSPTSPGANPASCTGCGRMDSHISKGNKKRTKQVTKKSFIFLKSTYNLVFFHIRV